MLLLYVVLFGAYLCLDLTKDVFCDLLLLSNRLLASVFLFLEIAGYFSIQ